MHPNRDLPSRPRALLVRHSCRHCLCRRPAQSVDQVEDSGNDLSGQCGGSHLEDGVTAMAHEACSSLYQAFAQAGQRPPLDQFRRGQCSQEVGEVVGQGVKLKTNFVGRNLTLKTEAAAAFHR